VGRVSILRGNIMHPHTFARAATLSLFVFCSVPASAQAVTYKLHCHDVGYNPAQPLGDREGHSISVSQFTCRTEGGPFDGGTVTGNNIWEWDKINAVLLTGNAVVRKPGATAVSQSADGKLALTVGNDGKVTGWTASGKGNWRLATGGAAAYSGKGYTWTAVPSGAGQFIVDIKVD
jgi:hypothetical protein